MSKIFNKIIFSFNNFYTMQFSPNAFNVIFNLFPNSNGNVFGRNNFPFHKINLNIQVFVINFFNHTRSNNFAQILKVDYKTGLRIYFPLNRYK